MLKALPAPNPPTPRHIKVYDLKPPDKEDMTKKTYLDQLKSMVFDEVLKRIEKNMDVNAADILDTARVKLKELSQNSKMILIALKPICLLFVVQAYLEVPVSI